MTNELLDIRIKKFKKCQLSCFYCDKLKLLVWNITNTYDDQKYDVADYFVESCLLILLWVHLTLTSEIICTLFSEKNFTSFSFFALPLSATLFKTPLADEISGA